MENYCGRVPVNRLVLACHGIGQKLAVSNIAHDAACMRLLMRQLSQVSLHCLGVGGGRRAGAGHKRKRNSLLSRMRACNRVPSLC